MRSCLSTSYPCAVQGNPRAPAVSQRVQGVAALPLSTEGGTLLALLSSASTLYLFGRPGHRMLGSPAQTPAEGAAASDAQVRDSFLGRCGLTHLCALTFWVLGHQSVCMHLRPCRSCMSTLCRRTTASPASARAIECAATSKCMRAPFADSSGIWHVAPPHSHIFPIIQAPKLPG